MILQEDKESLLVIILFLEANVTVLGTFGFFSHPFKRSSEKTVYEIIKKIFKVTKIIGPKRTSLRRLEVGVLFIGI